MILFLPDLVLGFAFVRLCSFLYTYISLRLVENIDLHCAVRGPRVVNVVACAALFHPIEADIRYKT